MASRSVAASSARPASSTGSRVRAAAMSASAPQCPGVSPTGVAGAEGICGRADASAAGVASSMAFSESEMGGTAGRRRRRWATAPPRRNCPGPAAPPPVGAGRGWDGSSGAGAQAFEAADVSGARHGGTRNGQPNLRPASVNVNPFVAMASSTAASEVRYSYSRSSWW